MTKKRTQYTVKHIHTYVRKGAAKINEERVFWNSEIKRGKGWLGEGAGKGVAWGVDASEVWRDQTCSIMLSLMWLQCASATTSFSESIVVDRS